MSNKIFKNEEVEILSSNKFVKRVSAKGITYTDEFKRIFIDENELLKKLDMLERKMIKKK